jgi:hypothetical protein
MRGMDVGRPAGEKLAERMKPADGTFAAPPRRLAMSRCKGVPLRGPLAKSSRFPAPEKWLGWQRPMHSCAGNASEPYAIIFVVPLVPSPMEDPMCWEVDYKFFAEQKKAQDARIKQEKRAGVIDGLLNQANEQGEKVEVEATPVKEVAPAK